MIVMVRRFSDVRIYETETAPTIEMGSGSGGNNLPMIAYGVTTKGNGDAFINEQTHTSLSIGGGQAGQGYPCVLVVMDGDDINRQMESGILRGNDVDAPNIRGNRGR